MKPFRLLACLLTIALAGCVFSPAPAPTVSAVQPGAVSPTLTDTPALPTFTLPAAAPQRVVIDTPTPASTFPPQPSTTAVSLPPRYEPAGCQRPPDDLSPVEINGWTINARTLAMLQHAQEMYGGEIDLTGAALTQGSYHDNGSASFGTHLGGGAVDLAIFLPGTWTIDYPNLQRLVRSLRAAGFAAWVRDIDEVYAGSGYHIHAIAIGDPQLSLAATDQLTGTYGYFLGWNGLPQADGIPVTDREGGAILCGWMQAAGYSDLSADAGLPPARPPADWAQRLLDAAANMETTSHAASTALARSLYYFGGQTEEPDTLDGPLAGTLWQRAGLLPAGINPARAVANYRPTAGRMDALAGWLPAADYARLQPPLSAGRIGAEDFNLLPGDLVEMRGPAGSRMLVITERDAEGRAYSVTPVQQADGGWLVQRVVVYDLAGAEEDLLRRSAAQGLADTLDVLRYRWSGLPETLPVEYVVQPGDTLPELAARFGMRIEDLLAANPQVNAAQLSIGEELRIPRP